MKLPSLVPDTLNNEVNDDPQLQPLKVEREAKEDRTSATIRRKRAVSQIPGLKKNAKNQRFRQFSRNAVARILPICCLFFIRDWNLSSSWLAPTRWLIHSGFTFALLLEQ